MHRLPGVSGTLFPEQYLAERLTTGGETHVDRTGVRYAQWWHRVEATCGPASGLRTLFDRVAMPLAALLGFRASAVTFGPRDCRGLLTTPGDTPLILLLLPWAEQPRWRGRDVAAMAREAGAAWGLVLAPPRLSLVDARGGALRRTLDLLLPAVVESGSLSVLRACEATAFDPQEAAASPFERLVDGARHFQATICTDLQAGVAEALASVERVVTGRRPIPSTPGATAQALTIIYRILFLLFAESRGLAPDGDAATGRTYAMGALCRAAASGSPRFSLWDALAATTRLSRAGCCEPDLRLAAFNGDLFSRGAAPALEPVRPARGPSPRSRARDAAAAAALTALGSRTSRAGRHPISYRDLGVEQLGAVYERVLDRSPPAGAGRPGQRPATRHSTARKQTGTFYTPRALAEFVVRRTLAPLVEGASSDAILQLRIVDTAMGSGAFLVAACRYLAQAYARASIAEGRLAPGDLDAGERARCRRLVAERCLAGVDANPVAVQLARLSLWLTTLAHGRPLGFLDHRLRTGDSLIGATPSDLTRVPAASRRRRVLSLFGEADAESAIRQEAGPLAALVAHPDDCVADVHEKARRWRQLRGATAPLAPWREAATLWCARWFWPAAGDEPAPSPAELRALLDAILRRDRSLPAARVADRRRTAAAIGRDHRFFHWPLEFPDVFRPGGPGERGHGFDAVIGNPPWEMVRGEGGRTDDRRRLVRFVRESGLYPSCDRGHLNLYQPFLERALTLVRPGGRVGLVVPWGLAVDEGAAGLRARLLHRSTLETIVGLDNRRGLFPIHRGLRFAVVIAAAGPPSREIRLRAGVSAAADLDELAARDAPESDDPRALRVTRERLARVGGAAGRIPFACDPADLALLDHLTSTAPRLGAPDGWSARFGRELNATESRPHVGLRGLPVIDGKHLTPFRVDVTGVRRIPATTARRLLPDARHETTRLAYRDVSGAANTRSLIAAIVPAGVVTTHTIFCLRTPVAGERQAFLCGVFNSLVLNATVRLLMGGHVTTALVEDLPVPTWRGDDGDRLIALLADELSHHPHDVRARATLDALVASRYGLDAEQFDRVLALCPRVPRAEREGAAAAFRRLGGPRAARRKTRNAERERET